jgi:predicted GIY-YIG superfamily endonuclease
MEIQNQLLFCEIANKNGVIYFENYDNTDNLKDGYSYCVEQILSLKNNKKFYIGATHNYEERFLEHMENKKMFNMFVLTQAQTNLKSKKLEQKLIKRFGKNKNILNKVEYDNNGNILNGGGGEGLIHDKNYIYVLFK